MEKTTIQLSVDTLNRLKNIKRHYRESYDEIVNYLIDENQDDELSEQDIKDIKESLDQYKKGQVYSIDKVAKEMGISLK